MMTVISFLCELIL